MRFYNAIGFYLGDRGEPGVLSGLSGCAKVITLTRNMPSCGVSDTALGPDLGTIASLANAMRKPQAANDSSLDVLHGVVHWLHLL